MLISELLEDIEYKIRPTPRRIEVAPRALAEIKDFESSANYPGFKKNFENFLQTKAWYDPPRPWGKKDGAIGGKLPPLRGCLRVHILHGKVIAIYKVLGDAVRIYTVAAHWVVEHENLDGLARQVDKQERANSWIDVDLPPRETLPPQVQQDIADTFDLLNGDGKGANALRQFAQGNSQALIPYISMLKELGNDSLTQVPLTQLQKMAADWLKSGQ